MLNATRQCLMPLSNATHQCPVLLNNEQHADVVLLTNAQRYSPMPNATHQRYSPVPCATQYMHVFLSYALSLICEAVLCLELVFAELGQAYYKSNVLLLTNAQHADVCLQHGAVAEHGLLELPVVPHQLLDAPLHVELHSLVLVQLHSQQGSR